MHIVLFKISENIFDQSPVRTKTISSNARKRFLLNKRFDKAFKLATCTCAFHMCGSELNTIFGVTVFHRQMYNVRNCSCHWKSRIHVTRVALKPQSLRNFEISSLRRKFSRQQTNIKDLKSTYQIKKYNEHQSANVRVESQVEFLLHHKASTAFLCAIVKSSWSIHLSNKSPLLFR